MDVVHFLVAFSDWAVAQPDIAAVALVGSQACGTATPDSDVDLVILTENAAQYLQDTAWLSTFGEVERRSSEDYGAVTSLRVFYRGGPEVEFGFAAPRWAALPLDPGTEQVVAGGMRVLYDRDGLLHHITTT